MKKLISSFAVGSVAILFSASMISCQNNPYEGVGPVKAKNQAPPAPKPQGEYKIIGTFQSIADEGSDIVQKFEIKDDENPAGPFRVYLTNFPEGSTLKVISATQYEIHFVPNLTFVRGQASRVVEAQIHVINPNSKSLDAPITWTVSNKATQPYIVGPANLTAAVNSNLSFSLLSEDLNGEEFTHFSIVSPTNIAGITGREVLLNTDAKNIYPTTEYDVTWTNISTALVGQTINIKVQACNDSYQKCSTQNIQVNVIAQ